MCFVPLLAGQAIGGRTGAIVGGALGGGLPGALAATAIFPKKKQQPGAALSPASTFGS